MVAKKGDWVRIHKIVLSASERAPQVPEDTKQVPLEQWVKGFILSDAEMGDEVEIETVTQRKISGTLIEVNPTYVHTYGNYMPELGKISSEVKAMLQ